MKNDNALAFFARQADRKSTNLSVKFTDQNDLTDRDAEFILRFADSQSAICDLASGPGLIVNRIASSVRRIVAVEPFKAFTDKIESRSNVAVVNSTIGEFDSADSFDVVTLFAAAHYFNVEEIVPVYRKCFRLLNRGGVVIVKNQFGLAADVVVDGFSQEIGSHYYAEYRHLAKEMAILASVGFGGLEAFDIYPPESNRWPNTHFYAIVGQRP